jgi:hypothetical protein
MAKIEWLKAAEEEAYISSREFGAREACNRTVPYDSSPFAGIHARAALTHVLGGFRDAISTA